MRTIRWRLEAEVEGKVIHRTLQAFVRNRPFAEKG